MLLLSLLSLLLLESLSALLEGCPLWVEQHSGAGASHQRQLKQCHQPGAGQDGKHSRVPSPD